MRKMLFVAVLASTALASPALARDDSWYVEADGGATFIQDMTLRLNGTVTGTTSPYAQGDPVIIASAKTGFDFGGIVGYDFGPFRLEAEASYRRAGLDDLRVPSSTSLLVTGSTFSGRVSTLAMMLNGLIDIGPDDGLQGFIGGGVGYAHSKLRFDYASAPQGTDVTIAMDDGDSGFAWQLLAGARMPLSEHVDLGLKYRFANHPDVAVLMNETVSGEGTINITAPLRTRVRSHSALLTLAY
ncbi:MAG: porin family protein, partial [Novosphingobium sp.]|nr:porin family protein [Novosphingobium sp.]